jgi:hypothetical protein
MQLVSPWQNQIILIKEKFKVTIIFVNAVNLSFPDFLSHYFFPSQRRSINPELPEKYVLSDSPHYDPYCVDFLLLVAAIKERLQNF